MKKILTLEDFIVLEKMLKGTDEDMEVAFSNIKNFKLDIAYHMLFIKTLEIKFCRLHFFKLFFL